MVPSMAIDLKAYPGKTKHAAIRTLIKHNNVITRRSPTNEKTQGSGTTRYDLWEAGSLGVST